MGALEVEPGFIQIMSGDGVHLGDDSYVGGDLAVCIISKSSIMELQVGLWRVVIANEPPDVTLDVRLDGTWTKQGPDANAYSMSGTWALVRPATIGQDTMWCMKRTFTSCVFDGEETTPPPGMVDKDGFIYSISGVIDDKLYESEPAASAEKGWSSKPEVIGI